MDVQSDRERVSTVCNMTHHEWTETYYGYRCDNCGRFFPFGCEPWAPIDDDEDDDADAWRELTAADLEEEDG